MRTHSKRSMGCCLCCPNKTVSSAAMLLMRCLSEGFLANQRATAVVCKPCKLLVCDASARAAKAVLQVKFAVSTHSRATCRRHFWSSQFWLDNLNSQLLEVQHDTSSIHLFLHPSDLAEGQHDSDRFARTPAGGRRQCKRVAAVIQGQTKTTHCGRPSEVKVEYAYR